MILPGASHSVVRILRGDGTVVGAGFLVDARHIFTCAHVVAEALGHSPFWSTRPQELLSLDFPLLPHPTAPQRARVVLWQPVNEEWDGGDIAGLELLDAAPEGAQPATFAPTTDVWDHSFRAFGFPASMDKGTWSRGRLLAEQGNGWIQIEDNRSGGVPVTQGFSGGAVWDDQLGGVVGMVVATLHDPGGRLGGQAGTRVAFAIPQRLLLTAWPLIQPLTRPRVFLSAAHDDAPLREQLRADLEASGILVWDEQHEASFHSAEQSQQAIRAATALLVIASSHTASSLIVREHLRLADLYQRRIIFLRISTTNSSPTSNAPKLAASSFVSPVPPIHGDNHLPTRPPSSPAQPTPSDPDDPDGQDDLERKLAAIARQHLNIAWLNTHYDPQNKRNYKKSIAMIREMLLERNSLAGVLDALGEQEGVPRNPYVGLRAFTARERADFFGREAFVAHLYAEVGRRLATRREEAQGEGRLLTVIGASGSGKSSVVMAGLLPRLQDDPASKDWLYLQPLVPGAHPIEALVDTLSPHFPASSFKRLREDLMDDRTDGLHRLARQLAGRQEQAGQGQGRAQGVVLFVDQFEELFTQTVGEEERRRFLDLLQTAASAPGGAMLILLTLRADFYHRLMEYPDFYALLAPSLYPLLPLQSHELRAAITRPAEQPDVRLSFEGDLLGDLLFDMQRQAGALPLLQFTLQQLYERRQGHRLTLAAYKEIGEVNGALARYAQATYERLPPEQRELARILFLRLLDSSTEESTRRRASLSELAFPDPNQTRRMQATIDAFVHARLLTSSAHPGSGQTTIEVSHEALIRAWPLLADWLRAARDDLPIQRKISEDAAQWQHNKQPPDRLYRGSQLKEARAWAARNTLSVSTQEQTFLRASQAGRVRSILTIVLVTLLIIASSGITLGVIYFQPRPNYVTNTNDNGTGSLRWAIDNVPSGSTITFSPTLSSKTITLTSGDIHIERSNLTIRGPVEKPVLISNNRSGWSMVADTSASVTIIGMEFQGNHSDNNSSILTNHGRLNLNNCIVSHNINKYGHGGGIYNNGILGITNSTISNNTAGYGGGIFNEGGTLSVINSTVTDNATEFGDGGGISNYGTLSVINSVISHNTGTFGGGISDIGTLTVADSTISYNTSNDVGGGIGSERVKIINMADSAFLNDTLNITNSTISDNTAKDTGGGIAFYDNTLSNTSLIFCTIYRNRATRGNGIFIKNAGPLYAKGNIIAGANGDKDSPIVGEAISSNGYNLVQNMSPTVFISNAAHATDQSVDHITKVFGSTPTQRGSFGLTETYVLRPGLDNPAIDSVPLQACSDDQGKPINTDQLGMPRPGRNKHGKLACDIGAYESSN